MIKRIRKSAIPLFILCTVLGFLGGLIEYPPNANAQATSSPLTVDKNKVPTPNGRFQYAVAYSPADLVFSALTEPASPTATNNSALVNVAGAQALTLFVNCTQPFKLTLNTFDEVGTLYGSYDLFTAVPLGAQQFYIATELAPTATGGTAGAQLRLPQNLISFNVTNTGATPGTCTGRLIVRY